LIISLPETPHGNQSLNHSLEFASKNRALLDRAVKAVVEGVGGHAAGGRTYLVMNCAAIDRKPSTKGADFAPGWLDDGMTTFSLRAFDSRKNRVGTIRVSRHLTITYGLTDGLITDLNNLIYERILYGSWPTGSAEVFALLGALGDYVLPTEVSLYTHRVAQRLATFGVLVGILFAAILPLQGFIAGGSDRRLVVLGLTLLYIGFAALAVSAWILLGWLASRFADR
jgi:hypothetical protein